MPREELSLSAIVEKKEWCLIERSEIRQSFWTEIKERESFPRQGKCPSGQFLSLYTCMSPSGDSFFSIFRGCSNHKSTIIIAQRFTHENKNLEFSKLIHKSKPIKPYPLWILKSSSSLRRRIFHAAQVHGIDQFNRRSNTLLCDRRPIGRRFAQN